MKKFMMVLMLSSFSYAVNAAEAELSLRQAQSLTVALLKVRKVNSFIGHFRDRGADAKIFATYESILNQRLPSGPHRVLDIDAQAESLTLKVQLAGQAEITVLHATAAREAEKTPAQSKTSQTMHMTEALGLTINDTTVNDSPDQTRFVSVTQARGETDDLNGQIEAGIKFKRFTLSLFSRQLIFGSLKDRVLNQNGTALTVKMAEIGEFQLGIRLEAAHAVDSKVIVSEGVANLHRLNALNTQARLEITRSFGLSGVSVGGGVKFLYFGANALDREPLKMAFLRIGKSFKNRQGKEIVSVQLLATQELGREDNAFMASLVGTIKF